MRGTLIVVILAVDLLVGAGIEADQSAGQPQQVDLLSISQLRFAIRKFNLPKGLECQVFATKVSPLIGQQQAAVSHQTQTDIPSQPKKVLGQLAHFIESQPAWDGFSSNSGKRILLEYINHCISSLNSATNPIVEVPVVVAPVNEQQQQSSKRRAEIELLRRQMAQLKKARGVEADKAEKANQLIGFNKAEATQTIRRLEEANEKLKRAVAELELEAEQHQVEKKTMTERISKLEDTLVKWKKYGCDLNSYIDKVLQA